jgi:HSP20 family molecular chaperone IbpA
MVILPLNVAGRAPESIVARTRSHIMSLLRRCARLAGLPPEGAADEPQVLTLSPSRIHCTNDRVEIAIVALAQPEQIFVSSEERELIVEARIVETIEQQAGGATVRERIDKRFSRTFDLPWPIRSNSLTAELSGCELIIRALRLQPNAP